MRPSMRAFFLPLPAERFLSAGRGKSVFLALFAKLYLDGYIFFLILLRKIRKKMYPSKECFAAVGGKILFIKPPSN